MKSKRSIFVALLALLVALVGFSTLDAQTQTPRVTKRQVKQQARIKQGVNSGELTKGETARLEAGEARIQANKLEAKSDGKVTPAERAKLTKEQNRESRKINRLKHNGKKP